MWIWTTLRKPHIKHVNKNRRRPRNFPPGMPEGMAEMIEQAMGEQPRYEYEGYDDYVAVFDPEHNIIAWERPPDNEVNIEVVVYQFRDDDPIVLGVTLDEFARHVGAGPRPKVDVPDAFRDVLS